MRYFGTVKLAGRMWEIETEPQVAIRIKRLFKKIDKNSFGKQLLVASPENTRELEWFLQRYPMEMSSTDKQRMDELSNEHRATESLVADIMGGNYTPPAFDMAVQPRDYQRISAELAMRTGRLLIADDLGLGKQQPIDAKVLTPSGYVEIGSVKIGDHVIGSDGSPTKVLGVFPQGKKPCYRVTFSDHSSVECGPEHLWAVMENGSQYVLSTEQIWLSGRMGHMNIPTLSSPVKFTPQTDPDELPQINLTDPLASISPTHLLSSPDHRNKILSSLPHGTFGVASRQLASDIQSICECMGWAAIIEDDGSDLILSINGPNSTPRRVFEKIEYTRECESVCIKVAAADSLYATEHAILTHNTAQAICTFTDPSNLPALVVTLSHLPRQWEREIQRFIPGLRTHVLKKGTPYDICKEKRGKSVLFPDVIITNYHKLNGWAETLRGVVRTVVYDECQELRRQQSAKYGAASHISEAAKLRIGLSATPIYNYGGEIFSVIDAIAPGSLGGQDEFMREWCDSYISDRPKIRDPKAFGAYLREQGLMIRRTRSEVGRELEALTKIPQAIEADPEALSKIEDSAAELAKIILSQQTLKKGVKMQAAEQLSNVIRQATGIAKAPYAADFIRMIVEAGEPVLVFAWHREVYDIIKAKISDLNPVMYTGSESDVQKAAARDAFIKGNTKVMMMSLRSGAGLDGLQHVCRTVVFAELDWSPGVHDQCCGRVHRDGQKDPVMAYFLLSDYGSDPVMSDVLGVKRAQMQGIRDPNADVLSEAQASDNDAKKLAESFLRQRGLEVTEPKNLENVINLLKTEEEN